MAYRCEQLRAAHDSGPRQASWIKLVVVHSTEGGTAASVAEFFHTTAQASTQLVVDDDGCYRCLPDLVIPWGAPGANRQGLHVEHCGFALWSREEWLGHLSMLHLSAQHAARWAWQYGIPRRWLRPWQIRVGIAGFCRHADVTLAYPKLGDHTDPGPGFPRDAYLAIVKSEYAKLAEERAASKRARKRT